MILVTTDTKDGECPLGPVERGLTMGNYFATWSDDGSGDWSITLPIDCSEHDLDALSPLVQTIRDFLQPTLAARGVVEDIALRLMSEPTLEGVRYLPTEAS